MSCDRCSGVDEPDVTETLRSNVIVLRRLLRLPSRSVRAMADTHRFSRVTEDDRFTVALLPWGDLWEDYLDTLGVTFEQFRDEFVGSWIFGYAKALQRAGMRPILICISGRVTAPTRFTHRPTGMSVCIVPASRAYLRLRQHMVDPYATSPSTMFGNKAGLKRLMFAALFRAAPYLATPIATIGRELSRQGVQAVLCHDYENARFEMCAGLGFITHVPVFASFQGGQEPGTKLEQALRRVMIRRSTGLIIGPWSEIRRVRARYNIPRQRVGRIFNPVDVQLWRPIEAGFAELGLHLPSNSRSVIWHGRVEIEQKGLDVLIEAWNIVRDKNPNKNWFLILVGTGSGAEELRRLLDTAGVTNIVWMNSFIHDRSVLKRYLCAADVFVLPSRGEGFPVAPLEAMACGLPVIATDVSGIQDILEHGERDGGMVVGSNDPGALAAAMIRALENEIWCRDVGARARRRVEGEFSFEAVGRQLSAFITSRTGHRVEDYTPVVDASRISTTRQALRITSLSPSEVQVALPFNIQPRGDSALSVTAESADPSVSIIMGSTVLETEYHSPTLLSAIVPRKFLMRTRTYPVFLTDGVRASNQVKFRVAAAKQPSLVAINPTACRIGRGFNLQPGGLSAIAATTKDATMDTVIMFAGTRLKTVYHSSSLLTAIVPSELFAQPSRHFVWIENERSRSKPLEFLVEPEESMQSPP